MDIPCPWRGCVQAMKTLDEALLGLGYEHVRALSEVVGRAVLAHPTGEPGVERVVKPLRHPDTPALRGVVPYAQSLEHPALPRVWDVASSAGRLTCGGHTATPRARC